MLVEILKRRKIKIGEDLGAYKYYSKKTGDFIPSKLKEWLIYHYVCGFVRKMPNMMSNIIYCPHCKKYLESNYFGKIQIKISRS